MNARDTLLVILTLVLTSLLEGSLLGSVRDVRVRLTATCLGLRLGLHVYATFSFIPVTWVQCTWYVCMYVQLFQLV